MSYINHNVNFNMLFLVLLATTSLVLSTVFFQVKYDQVVNEYNAKAEEMAKLAEDLQLHQNALGKVNDALKLAQEREDAFGKITAKLTTNKRTDSLIDSGSASSIFKSIRKNPAGTVVNNAFSARPKQSSTALNGWGTF